MTISPSKLPVAISLGSQWAMHRISSWWPSKPGAGKMRWGVTSSSSSSTKRRIFLSQPQLTMYLCSISLPPPRPRMYLTAVTSVSLLDSIFVASLAAASSTSSSSLICLRGDPAPVLKVADAWVFFHFSCGE